MCVPSKTVSQFREAIPVNGLGSVYRTNDNEFMAPSLSCYLFLQEKYCYIKEPVCKSKKCKIKFWYAAVQEIWTQNFG